MHSAYIRAVAGSSPACGTIKNMNKLKLQKPFIEEYSGKYRMNQRFGVPDKMYLLINMLGHNGMDWALPIGVKIVASHDGIVTFVGEDDAIKQGYPTRGKGIEIKTLTKFTFGDKESYAKTLYWHLDKWLVKEGDTVKAGDVIGISGNTGMSTGPHLHWALKLIDEEGKTVNRGNGYLGAINQIPYIDIGLSRKILIGLKKGSRGQGVVDLQKAINYFGYFNEKKYAPNFGNLTASALCDFQLEVMGEELIGHNYINENIASNNPICGKLTANFINQMVISST